MNVKYYFLLPVISLFSCFGGREKNQTTGTADANDDRGYIVEVGDRAPDFSLGLTNGERFTLSDMRGKVVMLQFTASWCGVCRKEMPFIERDIRQKYKDDHRFYLLGIDCDEPLEKVLEFVRQTGVTYPIALDPEGRVFALYAEPKAGITRNVIIDPQGRIVMLTRLYDEKEFAAMCAKINEMLNKKQ